APRPRPAPAPKPAAPAPQPAPAPVAPPKPPPPVPEKRVLPQEAPTPKPRPKQKEIPPEAVQRREAPEKDYGDVLDQLRAEAGEDHTKAEAPPAPPAPAAASAPSGGGGNGKPVSPEIAEWMKRVRIHVRQSWVVPAGFRQQSISTGVSVELDASGNVVGEPEIVRRSGNPWYDDGVLRSILRASPLPAPPDPGRWTIVFESDETR